MKIKRIVDGVEHWFELTETELRLAYYEQENIYDTQDIIDLIEEMSPEQIQDDYCVSREEFLALAPLIADQMRAYLDSNQILWYDAREEAVNQVIEDYKKHSCPEDLD